MQFCRCLNWLQLEITQQGSSCPSGLTLHYITCTRQDEFLVNCGMREEAGGRMLVIFIHLPSERPFLHPPSLTKWEKLAGVTTRDVRIFHNIEIVIFSLTRIVNLHFLHSGSRIVKTKTSWDLNWEEKQLTWCDSSHASSFQLDYNW